ncbi:hypothetical protein [Acinetobacter radioresistens]|uniref:hypothetical protein n=1 Tax=Acinetobacter radioresistens TaxID=40216 RepID=UPI000C31FC97|nr:hypothetical protein [Acinetobacter radioresistens]MCK4089368.1 hypothetical protein [Acinetobacter radioresistens]PKH35203.1 hypothetical protein BJF94_02060 [Acinetobacter radioresistens]
MNKVILFDLEQNKPAASLLRELLQHYSTLYLFNCQKQFEYALVDLTELAGWIQAGRIVVLETAEADFKEFEYALVVGQCLALLEADVHVDVISAMPESELLVQLLGASAVSCSLIKIEASAKQKSRTVIYRLPSREAFEKKPQLQLVKKYCDLLGKMPGKPATIQGLKHSIISRLNIFSETAQQLVGLLINLKIVRSQDGHVSYRKRILAHWLNLKLEEYMRAEVHTMPLPSQPSVETFDIHTTEISTSSSASLEAALKQQRHTEDLYSEFARIDPLQWQIIRHLDQAGHKKPDNIYALRDLLKSIFPEANVQLLLKEMLEKGYIYWDGYKMHYSPEILLH